MKRSILAILVLLFTNFSFSQSDSTDLNLYMTDPILLDEMDSLMFSVSDYGELYIEFNVSDTVSFDGINVEISTTGDDEVLYKAIYTKTDLQSNSSLDSNWHATIDLGKFEKGTNYTITFVVKDYNGLLGESIIKHFIYEAN